MTTPGERPSTLTAEELAELKELCELATPGPWTAGTGHGGEQQIWMLSGTETKGFHETHHLWSCAHEPGIGDLGDEEDGDEGDPQDKQDHQARIDADFIATARTAIPMLLAALGALEEDKKRLEDAARDALSGWRYIREVHGDLYGVGWDRVEMNLANALPIDTALNAGRNA